MIPQKVGCGISGGQNLDRPRKSQPQMRWRDTILLMFGWGSASSPGAVLVISTPQASIYFGAFWLCQGFHPSLESEMEKKQIQKFLGAVISDHCIENNDYIVMILG